MSKKALIIFHSVCGNTFLLAKEYQQAFQENGIETDLFRVEDGQFEKFAVMFEASQETKAEIEQVPIITDCQKALAYDYIILGSPTYFGNVSGPIKLFMDSFVPLFMDSNLYGKKFTSFTASSAATGGADMCLKALNTFALHLGMTVMAVPANLKGAAQPAYGIAHFSGGDSTNRPDHQTKTSIHDFVKRMVQL